MTTRLGPVASSSTDDATAPKVAVFRPLYRMLGHEHRRAIRWALVLKTLQAGLAAAPIVLLGPLLADVADGGADPLGWTIVYVAVLAVEVVAAIAANRVLFTTCFEVGADLRHRLIDRLDVSTYGSLHHRGSDGPTAVITRDVADVESFISGSVPPLVSTTGVVFALAVGLVVLDPAAGAVAIVAGLAATFVGRVTVQRFARLGVERTILRSAVDERVSEHVNGIAVARSLGRGAAELDQFSADLTTLKDANLEATRRVIPMSALRSSLLWTGPAAVLAMLAFRAASDSGLDGPRGVAALVVSLALAIALDDVLGRTGSLPGISASIERIRSLFELPIETGPAQPIAPPDPRPVGVELRDVAAGYDPSSPVLRGCTMVAEAGKVTAIVGPSGAGKTTILRVIAGFLNVSEGSVRIGGVDAADLDADERMCLVGLVPQQVRLVQGSIADNIAFGRPPSSREGVEHAAVAAHLDPVLDRLPDGLDAAAGVGGAALSGGERQRIAIARAVLDDAPVLLLDEATSALDATNERLVQESLAALGAGRTAIVVAHRISTLRRADHVVVVEEGCVVEAGPPATLLVGDGPFARLFAERSAAAGWRLES